MSTPTLVEKAFTADRELRISHLGEHAVCLPFKQQQQKWQDTFETWHSKSRRKETLLLSWHTKCQFESFDSLKEIQSCRLNLTKGSKDLNVTSRSTDRGCCKINNRFRADETPNTLLYCHTCTDFICSKDVHS